MHLGRLSARHRSSKKALPLMAAPPIYSTVMDQDERDRWDRIASSDPYFGVLVEPRFRGRQLSGATRAAFFATGMGHVDQVLRGFHRLTGDPRWDPDGPGPIGRILDIGCGVGRITLPLARRATEAVGVDISPLMLSEAAENARLAGLSQSTFVRSDPELTQVTGQFDLIHSYITFQHIPPPDGCRLLASALRRLAPNGVAMIHMTTRTGAPIGRMIRGLRRRFPALNTIIHRLRGWPPSAPFIPMYPYHRPPLVALFDREGIQILDEVHTDHGGHIGIMFFLRRYRAG